VQSQSAAAEQPLLKMMATQGQSYLSATGDAGSEECGTSMVRKLGVQDPSSQPFAIAVGGTNLNAVENPPAVVPSENAWSGSGGGISSLWPMPAWEADETPFVTGMINSYSTRTLCHAPANSYCRELPDVSADAGVGYATLTGSGSGPWGHIGGTSLATPTWAAVLALVDASTSGCQARPVGFADPDLYATSVDFPGVINDITTGNNANGDSSLHGKYPATQGYDLATGLGTPEAAILAQELCGARPLWTPKQPEPDTFSPMSPAVTASGHTVYLATTNTSGDIEYLSFSGTAWGSPAELKIGGNPVATADSPSIAVTDGHLAIGWTSLKSHKVEVSTQQDGVWSPAEVVGAGKAVSDSSPSLASGAGELFVAWKGSDTANVYLSADNRHWTAAQQVAGAATVTPPALTWFAPVSALVVAWTTAQHTIDYEDQSVLGFGALATIPDAQTGTAPTLSVIGKRLYVAWTGEKLDVSYAYEEGHRIYGTWEPALPQPYALADGPPSMAPAGLTLYTFWLSNDRIHIWYDFANPFR
jgi:hypothetical protein